MRALQYCEHWDTRFTSSSSRDSRCKFTAHCTFNDLTCWLPHCVLLSIEFKHYSIPDQHITHTWGSSSYCCHTIIQDVFVCMYPVRGVKKKNFSSLEPRGLNLFQHDNVSVWSEQALWRHDMPKLKWKRSSVLLRASIPMNTFRMNWKAKRAPDLVVWHN